jgi:bla regulator protein BlaR1
MDTLSATTSLLTQSLAWALLYSLWQGLLIYCTLYALLRAVPNINARVKYYLSFGAHTALFLWFADTWVTQYQKLKGITVYITQAGIDNGIATTYPIKTYAATQAHNTFLNQYLPGFDRYFPFIIIIYTIGLSFMLFRFVVNVFQVNGLRRLGLTEPEPAWNDFISRFCVQFEILRPVKLFISNRISVPMMLGVIKPVILLPVATINHLSTEQVEAILLHELAHIRRQDYLLNIFQTIVETILFFNPFVWLLSSIIRKEREHCCDDMVVASAANPLPYAKALAILEGNRINTNSLTLAATGRKNQLFHRIKRIMEMKKKNLNYGQLTIIIVALVTLTFTIAMFTFTPSLAQKVKGDSTDTTRKNTYHYKTVTVDKNGKKTVTEEHTSTPKKNKGKDDDDNVDVTVSINDDKDAKASKGSTYAYSYSYDDGDDVKKVINEITIATRDALENAEKAMSTVDWNEVRDEINKGLEEVNKELNDPKLHKEINESVKKALEKSRDALEKAEEQMNSMPPMPPIPPVPPITPVAPMPPMPPGSHSESYSGSSNYETMLNKMEKDGLIDRSSTYKIKKDDNELYINGEKQPESVYNKYRKYLKDKSVTIKGKKGALTININD